MSCGLMGCLLYAVLASAWRAEEAGILASIVLYSPPHWLALVSLETVLRPCAQSVPTRTGICPLLLQKFCLVFCTWESGFVCLITQEIRVNHPGVLTRVSFKFKFFSGTGERIGSHIFSESS